MSFSNFLIRFLPFQNGLVKYSMNIFRDSIRYFVKMMIFFTKYRHFIRWKWLLKSDFYKAWPHQDLWWKILIFCVCARNIYTQLFVARRISEMTLCKIVTGYSSHCGIWGVAWSVYTISHIYTQLIGINQSSVDISALSIFFFFNWLCGLGPDPILEVNLNQPQANLYQS